MLGTARMTNRLRPLMPEMNGSSTPVTREPFWIGMTIDIIRRNQPAPAICAASSGSLPSWVMAEIPAREA
ncbi:hypothetical protein D3C86_2009650 [compost metagenome]